MLRRIQKVQKAFTLIELLVVIAIILVLVAILLPSLNQARQIAGSVSCRSKLKSIGTATWLYIKDYNENFVQWENMQPGKLWGVSGDPYNTVDFLYPDYVESKAIFFCKYNTVETSWHKYIERNEMDYFYNNPVMRWYKITNISKVFQPQEAPLYWDFNYIHNSANGCFPPHYGGLSVLYVDGHVIRDEVPDGVDYFKITTHRGTIGWIEEIEY